jgi:DMSO/TMAO reductase YedYZ molybdopterin-dependent catalytic subunit
MHAAATPSSPGEGRTFVRRFRLGLLASGPAVLILVAAHLGTGRPGLLEIVAGGVPRYLPLAAFEVGLGLLGPLAKGVLYALVAAGAVLLGALLAPVTCWATRRLRGPAAVATTAVIAATAVELVLLPLAGAGPLGSAAAVDPLPLQVPLLAAALAYGAAVVTLDRSATVPTSTVPTSAVPAAAAEAAAVPTVASTANALVAALQGPRATRRQLLARGLGLLGVTALVAAGGGVAAQLVEVARTAGRRITTPPAADPFGPTPALTPLDRFYTVSIDLAPPAVDAASWALAIDGLVARPTRLTLEALRALPAQEGYRTLECISDDIVAGDHLISNQRWRGVRVRDLLDLVAPLPAAAWVLWGAEDGYTESLPLEVARDDETWIAYEMGGLPLPPEHGFPARVLVAGRFGMKQPKWVRQMTLAAHDAPGYWEQRGWDEQALVRTMSRIDAPAAGDTVPANRPVPVTGVANAGDRGIWRVEVSTDGGATWHTAALEPLVAPLGPLTWVRWRAEVTLAPGTHVLVVRATDGTGAVQDGRTGGPLPSGATGWEAIAILAA